VKNAAVIKGKGIDTIAVTGVNDVVRDGRLEEVLRRRRIEFLADGSANWAKAMGLTADLTERGLGVRSQRYAMLVDDGVLKTPQTSRRPRQGRDFERGKSAEITM